VVCTECGDNTCCRLDKKCVTTVSPTGKGLTIIPTTWQNLCFKDQITIVCLSGYYPADLATRFNWYSTTFPETIPNHLRLRLNRRWINGCISYMPLILTAIAIRLLNVFRQIATFWEIIIYIYIYIYKVIQNTFRFLYYCINDYPRLPGTQFCKSRICLLTFCSVLTESH